jgi:hypothetical protein
LLFSFLPRYLLLLESHPDSHGTPGQWAGRCYRRGLELIFHLLTLIFPATPFAFHNISALKAYLVGRLNSSRLVRGLRKTHAGV